GLEPESLMFRDGRRRIDMVLAYEEEDYGENLIREGLEVELENKCLSFDEKTWFLKIHIPWKTEMRLAEVIGMKLPTKRFITISVKAWMGIRRLLNDGTYLACFPLHEGRHDIDLSNGTTTDRRLLYLEWARPSKWYKKQPLCLVRRYFGDKIGLYFCWLGFYTKMLYAPAIVGTLCFLYGLATTTFLELWKRKQSVLRWEWDLGKVDQIYAKVAVFLTNIENPRTQTEYEDSYTFKIFFFEFMNFYSSLIYIAFFKRSHRAVTRDLSKPHMAWEQDYHLQDPGRLALFDEYLEMMFNTSDYKDDWGADDTEVDPPTCAYRGYRNPPSHVEPYGLSPHYWHVFAARLAFVVVFEHVVFGLTGLMQLFIPDVPSELRTQMQRETLLAKEANAISYSFTSTLAERPAPWMRRTSRASDIDAHVATAQRLPSPGTQ
ncbi:Anoctamin, partial [Operophtera brumata]